MYRSQAEYEADLVNRYAGKFLADNRRNTLVTDETLEKTFCGCVIPAKKHLYPSIKARIAEMREDPSHHFCGDQE